MDSRLPGQVMAGSLKRRLIVILLGLTLLTWAVSVLLTTYYAGEVMVRQIDQHLTHYSEMAQHTMDAVLSDPVIQNHFRARSTTVSSDTELTRVTSFHDMQGGSAVNLWFGQSQVLVGENAPQFPAPLDEGFVTWQMEEGSLWRVLYNYSPELKVWRATGIDLQTAREGGVATFRLALLPLLFILPITLVVLYYGIRRGLQPLNNLAEQIAARNLQALEPFEITDVPSELKPVVISLNGLLERLERALTSEQRFTSNAAHELQTPLAAIQAAVQSCQHQLVGVSDCGGVQVMLGRILTRVSGATDMVRQLLTLARLDPDQEFERESVEMGALIADTMAELGNLAMERQIIVRFNDQSQAVVQGNAEWLKILLRNVFTNAFKYSPTASEVEVVIESCGGYVRLAVSNDCEPIPSHEFQRLTERFYHPSAGGDHGAGLGLSIVQRIAELHRAELFIGPRNATASRQHSTSQQDNRGFTVEVHFWDTKNL